MTKHRIKFAFAFFLLSLLPAAARANASDDHQYEMSLINSGERGVAAVMILDAKTGKLWEVMDQQPVGQNQGGTWIKYVADISKLPAGAKIGEIADSTVTTNNHPVAPPVSPVWLGGQIPGQMPMPMQGQMQGQRPPPPPPTAPSVPPTKAK